MEKEYKNKCINIVKYLYGKNYKNTKKIIGITIVLNSLLLKNYSYVSNFRILVFFPYKYLDNKLINKN